MCCCCCCFFTQLFLVALLLLLLFSSALFNCNKSLIGLDLTVHKHVCKTNFFLDTFKILLNQDKISIQYLPENFQKLWLHHRHTNKWEKSGCLLLTAENQLLHSGCVAWDAVLLKHLIWMEVQCSIVGKCW